MTWRYKVLAAALAAEAAGISVLPPKLDGTKRPYCGPWGEYKTFDPDTGKAIKRMTRDDLRRFYASGHTGIGWVCGRASGNLEEMDFDDFATYERYHKTAVATGLGAIVERIEASRVEATPKDGRHWPYRCAEIAGNEKLARRPGPPDEHGNPTIKVLIETRGEGGYVVVAPSYGRVHSTGKSYRLLRGGVATIATITPNERRALWELARTFDEMPRPKVSDSEARLTSSERSGDRPGDDFNRRARWQDVLKGWALVYESNGVAYWRRPGKDFGISATTGYGDHDYLYCFSTSTRLESERGYSKFSAYAVLEHDRDCRAAARALAAKGYGSAQEQESGALRTCRASTVARTLRTAPAGEVAKALRLAPAGEVSRWLD